MCCSIPVDHLKCVLIFPCGTNIIALQGQAWPVGLSLTPLVKMEALQYPQYRKDKLKQSFYQGNQKVLGKAPSYKGGAGRDSFNSSLLITELKLHHQGVNGTISGIFFLSFLHLVS